MGLRTTQASISITASMGCKLVCATKVHFAGYTNPPPLTKATSAENMTIPKVAALT